LFKLFCDRFLENFRIKLAAINALPQLSLMGLLSGSVAGIVILCFRGLVEFVQSLFLPFGQPENYEQLNWLLRFLIPTFGGILIGLWFQITPIAIRVVGVVHVMERLAYHQGYLPLSNAIQQFFGAAICIITGHSVGREGPTVHLGAASGSLLGQWLQLPNNSIRTLVACGTAAAIAAAFNTPLAGVIFAMEVVLMEYTVIGFTPVILAAVIGAVMTRFVYGPAPAFNVPSLELLTPQLELPYLLLIGVVIGTLAAIFIQLIQTFTIYSANYPFWQRATLAGLITGLVGIFVPPIMGIGYDTVEDILAGQAGLLFLLSLVVFKLLLTTFGLGLGLPGGLIGPTLMIGAAAGSVMGILAEHYFPLPVSSPALYAMLGMGAMMGATLQAPLAALTALLELTANPNLILPGMLVIVVSNLVTSHTPFNKNSIFLELIRVRGLDYHHDPITQSLHRIGVASVMERKIQMLPRHITRQLAEQTLRQQPTWIIITEPSQQYYYLLLAADLALFLTENREQHDLDLMSLSKPHQQLAPVSLQATLQEALDILRTHQVEALYVFYQSRLSTDDQKMIYGVLTYQDLVQQINGLNKLGF
jgi:CIC family chloride channel protein